MLILEKINISNLIKSLTLIIFKKKKFKTIYYIYDITKLNYIYKNIFRLLGFELSKLDFKMIEIRETNKECVNFSIPRKKLFELESIINIEYELTKYNLYQNQSIKDFILKSIFAEDYLKKNSPFRIIYLLDVISFFMNKYNVKDSTFILTNYPFFYLYTKYANEKGISIDKTYSFYFGLSINFLLSKSIIKKIYFKYLYLLKKNHTFNDKITHEIKLYCEGKSQPNLLNDGNRSDFFWLLNSNFSKKNVLYNSNDKNVVNFLKKNQINATLDFNSTFFYNYKFIPLVNLFKSFFNNKINYHYIISILNNYEYFYNKWYNYLKTHNVKISLCWYKYDSQHIVMNKALNNLGGISCFYQMNFDGHEYYESKLYTDINFCFSKFSATLDKKINSKIKHQIITGYPMIKITENMKSYANKIRNKLLNNGAEKIVCILDENSLSDERWHTGHNLQRENYSAIINELLKNNKLGVIFKPKSAYDIRDRLGKYEDLLNKAISTGRCFIYENVEQNKSKFTKATPIQAALSSDLIIHSHLSAGTAAIECAKLQIPTILLDRENDINSVMHKYVEKKNIFYNWDSIINELNSFFFDDNGDKNLGNWENSLKYFDPFNDNNASQRIGIFLDNLKIGFENGLTKEDNINLSIKKYRENWGNDKVISS